MNEKNLKFGRISFNGLDSRADQDFLKDSETKIWETPNDKFMLELNIEQCELNTLHYLSAFIGMNKSCCYSLMVNKFHIDIKLRT